MREDIILDMPKKRLSRYRFIRNKSYRLGYISGATMGVMLGWHLGQLFKELLRIWL